VVFHRDCGVALDRIVCADVAEHADRAQVFFYMERQQLEVSTRAEG
jgi:hypothetical protein